MIFLDSGVERVIDDADWTSYSNLASMFVDAGMIQKEAALIELEKRNACKDLSAYQFLITLYGRTGNINEVYRVWCSLRLANISYLNMENVEVDGAEEFLEILKKSVDSLGVEVFESLIRTYAAAGRSCSAMQQRLKMERLVVSEETQKLLEAISME